jgi:hypothetical protein
MEDISMSRMNRKSPAKTVLTSLIAIFGLALTGCNTDSDSLIGVGNEILKGDSYMTAQVNGKTWSASSGAFFVNYDKPAKDGKSTGGGLQITAMNSLDEMVTFMVSTAKPDSFPLGALKFSNLAGYEKGGDAYLVRTGYVKITRVTEDQVEGVFELDMVADEDALTAGKLLRFRDGHFKAGTTDSGLKSML